MVDAPSFARPLWIPACTGMTVNASAEPNARETGFRSSARAPAPSGGEPRGDDQQQPRTASVTRRIPPVFTYMPPVVHVQRAVTSGWSLSLYSNPVKPG